MAFISPIRCVLGKKIESQTTQQRIIIFLTPYQLQLADGNRIRIGNLYEEEFAKGENSGFITIEEFERFVECVWPMLTTGRSNYLKNIKHLSFDHKIQ